MTEIIFDTLHPPARDPQLQKWRPSFILTLMKLSVTIITKNEERNVAKAIESVLFADEVILVDSGSTDKTKDVARALGAKVFDWPFQGYGQQKNYADSLCLGTWILNIDADEVVSLELAEEIKNIVNRFPDQDGPIALYHLPRLNHYCGKSIYHGGWYPDHKKRFYRRGKTRWTTPKVHEDVVMMEGLEALYKESATPLKGALYHYPFQSIREQVEKNLRYALLGAEELVNKKRKKPHLWHVVLKPLGKFLECYILKQGYRDGLYGWIIAVNASYSMFLKYIFAYTRE
jgi:glycosyltransferase involved in cell wall biosynthesis